MRLLRTLFDGFGLLVFFGLMYFVYRNREIHASIDLWFGWYEKIPVAMIVLGSMLAGSILALLFAIPEWLRLRSKLRDLRDSRPGSAGL
jgi:uncharacterized integral membrane protein